MPAAAEPAIELTDLSVRYCVPTEVISSFKEYAIRKLQGRVEGSELVALKDVSLTIQPGERVGIIGPNGAGKSTLFRVIARVVRPSDGRVVVRGDVAPLLALGLGFHGELTGRENIVLHGTLLGRSRQEMLERTPAIAAFAELEPFLDAPIRTYSTGMSARLAFAVATEVDPDILLVDEVLAVGDERFRGQVQRAHGAFPGAGQDVSPRLARPAAGHGSLPAGRVAQRGTRRPGRTGGGGVRGVPRVGERGRRPRL